MTKAQKKTLSEITANPGMTNPGMTSKQMYCWASVACTLSHMGLVRKEEVTLTTRENGSRDTFQIHYYPVK